MTYNVVPRSNLRLLKIIAALFVAAFVFAWLGNVFAQSTNILPDSNPVINAAPSGPEAVATGLIVNFATGHPWVATLLFVMGALRLLFKPIMMALEAYVKNTPGAEDDAKLAAFESGTIYKVLSHVLDFLGSVKLPTVASAANAKAKNNP